MSNITIIGEMYIKTAMRYHLTPVRMAIIKKPTNSAGEGVERREPSYTAGGNVHRYSHYEEQYRGQLKKTELPHDPAISLLHIYPEKHMIQKNTCTPVFTAALFTTAQTWNNLDVHQQRNGQRYGTYTYGILLSH